MLGWLVLSLILVPLLELAILIQVGRLTSVVATIAIVVLTGVIGAALARRQGFATLQRIRSEIAAGRIPANELAEGLLILLAGLLLITPGFLTDLLGFALLIPPSRRFFLIWLQRWFRAHLQRISVRVEQNDVDEFAEQANGEDVAAPGPERGREPMKYVENRAQFEKPSEHPS